jgi:hypothetical protein
MQIVAGRNRPAWALDADDDGFHGVVARCFFDLPMLETELTLQDRSVDTDDGDLVPGRGGPADPPFAQCALIDVGAEAAK